MAADTAAAARIAELEEHRVPLLKFAMLQVRDRASAEDLVQETFAAAIAALERFEGRSSLRTWLTRILLNNIADHQRAASREVPLETGDGESLADFFHADGRRLEMPQAWRNPDDALGTQQFYDALERCVAGLSRTASRVFLLRELVGLTVDEICKELGISASNCSVLLHRSRLRLRSCLEKRWFR